MTGKRRSKLGTRSSGNVFADPDADRHDKLLNHLVLEVSCFNAYSHLGAEL